VKLLPEPVIGIKPGVGQRVAEAGDDRQSIEACSPLPPWMRTSELSSPYGPVYAAGPPSASVQYAASRSAWSGSNPRGRPPHRPSLARATHDRIEGRERARLWARLTYMTRICTPARIAIGCAALTLMAAGCGSAAVQTRAGTTRPAVTAAPAASLLGPGQVISYRTAAGIPQPVIAISDAQTGVFVRELLPGRRDGMAVTGLSLDSAGNLWITYSKGPALRAPGTAGGDPQPDSCGNEVAVLHATTGRLSVVLRTGDNVLIGDATVSPDGSQLAYSESGCATGYFNSYLRITDLRGGLSWTIGAGLPRCHSLTGPAWDGTDLLVGYAPATVTNYAGPQNTCIQPAAERLVRLSTAAQPGLVGAGIGAGGRCEFTSVVGLAGGAIAAVEACGDQQYINGPARLVILTSQFRQLAALPLGRCTDGNRLSPDASGRHLLIIAYLYCNPPGLAAPVTRLYRYSAGVLQPGVVLTGFWGGYYIAW